jgi:hypothetical protein
MSVAGPFTVATRFNATRVNVNSSSSEPRGFGDDVAGSAQASEGSASLPRLITLPDSYPNGTSQFGWRFLKTASVMIETHSLELTYMKIRC